MPRVFLSYRRDDTKATTRDLYDYLVARFSESQVFMDVDSIRPGEDFEAVLEETLTSTDIMVLVIGARWLTLVDRNGRPRLEDPGDFVRLELESAFSRKIPVVCFLVDDAALPSAKQLPSSFSVLPTCDAVKVVSNRVDGFEAIAARVSRLQETRICPLDGTRYVWVPPGRFKMGAIPGDEMRETHETPQHNVSLRAGFWISVSLISSAAYSRLEHTVTFPVTPESPSDTPRTSISWSEARQYCELIGGRLPTEAEWEYVARAGFVDRILPCSPAWRASPGPNCVILHSGSNISLPGQSIKIPADGDVHGEIYAENIELSGRHEGNLIARNKIALNRESKQVGNLETARISIEDGALFKGDIQILTPSKESFNHLVAFEIAAKPNNTFGPNAFGLLDMFNGVAEWCQDWYSADYYRNSSTTDPQGPMDGTQRIIRGDQLFNLRLSARRSEIPSYRDPGVGFRCVIHEDWPWETK